MNYLVILKAEDIEELRDILGLIFSQECEHYLHDIKLEQEKQE